MGSFIFEYFSSSPPSSYNCFNMCTFNTVLFKLFFIIYFQGPAVRFALGHSQTPYNSECTNGTKSIRFFSSTLIVKVLSIWSLPIIYLGTLWNSLQDPWVVGFPPTPLREPLIQS